MNNELNNIIFCKKKHIENGRVESRSVYQATMEMSSIFKAKGNLFESTSLVQHRHSQKKGDVIVLPCA